MNRLLAHIFDNSACLTKRQLKDYVTGVMAEEECYTVERHANDCSFCSEAIDGLSAYNGEAVSLLETLTPEFIHDHFQRNLPPVHLNSIAPAAVAEPAPEKHKKTGIGWLQISALAMTLTLAFFLIRGWKPEHRQVTLPVFTYDTTRNAPQEPVTELSRKKSVLPPVEKNERITGTALASVSTATATDTLHDTKTAGSTQEQNTAVSAAPQSETTAAPNNTPPVPEGNTATTSTGTDNANHLQLAGEAFDRAHYTKALGHYRQVLNNNAATREDKDAAGIMAARCYILLGSKTQAISLLREIADGNSPRNGDARALLAELLQ